MRFLFIYLFSMFVCINHVYAEEEKKVIPPDRNDDYNSYPGDIYDHFESDDPFPEEGPTLEETYNVNVMYYMINWGYGETDNTYYVSYHPLNYTYNDDYGTVPYKDGKQMFYDFYIK